MKREFYQKLEIVTVLAIAMAFLESMIVIYLRKLYYPLGFNFPLSSIDSNILALEWVRESFTLVMLISIGILAGKKFYDRFAYFLYAFAIWDIFYYIWLKVILDWPSSFLTMDLLFLIPWPWVGPVLAPILLSLTMILLAFVMINFSDKKKGIRLLLKGWVLLCLGSLIILYTFLIDYGKIIFSNNFASQFLTLATNIDLQNIIKDYIPPHYNWFLFLVGEVIILIGAFFFWNRNKKVSWE